MSPEDKTPRTLGDYRKAASPIPNGDNSALHDTIRTAFEDYRNLLQVVFEDVPADRWNWRRETETSEGLRLSIRLFEFAVTYKDVGSIYKLHPDWPVQHVDKNLTLIPTDKPRSYGDAVFRLARGQGWRFIHVLQRAWWDHRKGGHIEYFCPFSFLKENPQVNELVIFPEPHRIIKAFFNHIIDGLKDVMLRDELSVPKVNSEFEIVCGRLNQEQNLVQKPLDEFASITLRDFDQSIFDEIAGTSTLVGIEYLAGRLPGKRKAEHPDPKTVRSAVNRLVEFGLVQDSGERDGISATAKGKGFADWQADNL